MDSASNPTPNGSETNGAEQSVAAESSLREVRYEVSRDFPGVLNEMGISLLVSTYQAGKLVVIGANDAGLTLSFHNFDQAMGVAVSQRQIAVGGRSQIWFLRNASALAARLDDGPYDACYLARSSHFTDEIHGHELAWAENELWVVNTRFSCLCTLHEDYSFVPRWWPPFISGLAAEDRCHLNGLHMQSGKPKYVTAMSETDTATGWRPVKSNAGCLIDVPSGETIARGFAMPHSPRVHAERIWVLDSGRGQLTVVDPQTGHLQPVSQQPGYTRGLAFAGPYAFVGLSKVRESSTFGGVPIAEQPEQLKCAVVAIDLRTGQRVGYFEFMSGVEEIFDVRVLAGMRRPYFAGPLAALEAGQNIWYAPRPGQVPLAVGPARPLSDDVAAASPVDVVPSSIDPQAVRLYKQGNELSDRDQWAEAEGRFREAVKLDPGFAEAHCNLGVVLQFQGRLDESVLSFEQSLSIHPDAPAPHFNLAMSRFLQEDFARAWPEYEWRWQCKTFGNRPAAAIRLAPPWDGSPLDSRTILVYGEQGIGDEIMFASCLPDLIEQAQRCVVACEMRLVPLIARSFPAAHVVPVHQLEDPARVAELGQLDVQIAAGSVPQHVRPSRASFPRCDSYLRADPLKVQRWRERLAALEPGLRIGISWRGGKEPLEVRRRSTTLRQWQPILSVPGVCFVNLQYGPRATELARIQTESGIQVHDWPDVDPLLDIDDFAAQISALDLVISIDNSTVHLAGSLGVETWMLSSFPSSSYWRWSLDRDDTPWYASVRNFRKTQSATWQASFELVRDMLVLRRSEKVG